MAKRKGFSLVELLTAISIASLVIFLIGSLYFAHFKIFSNQNTQIDVTSQTKLAIDDIINQVRQSETVVASCPSCGADTTGSTVIILRMWPLDASGEPYTPGPSAYDYVLYKRDATDQTKLLKKVFVDAQSTRKAEDNILATYITNLSFTYNNADPTLATEITVTVSATRTALGKTFTSDAEQKAILRNK